VNEWWSRRLGSVLSAGQFIKGFEHDTVQIVEKAMEQLNLVFETIRVTSSQLIQCGMSSGQCRLHPVSELSGSHDGFPLCFKKKKQRECWKQLGGNASSPRVIPAKRYGNEHNKRPTHSV
jgi:hypothetical protein